MDHISLYCMDIDNHLIKNLGELNIRTYKDWILFIGNDSITLIQKNLSKVKITKEDCKKILDGIESFENKYINYGEKNNEIKFGKKNYQKLDFIPFIKTFNEYYNSEEIQCLNKIIISKGITQFISDKENLYSIFWFFK